MNSLPKEVELTILHQLDTSTILNCGVVCKNWRKLLPSKLRSVPLYNYMMMSAYDGNISYLLLLRGKWNPCVPVYAAHRPSPGCLSQLFEYGCPRDSTVIQGAIDGDSAQCLKYLCDTQDSSIVPSIPRLIDLCCCKGALECLKYLHTREECSTLDRSRMRLSVLSASGNGRVECMKYLIEMGYPVDPDCCYVAAAKGHLNSLVYLHSIGHKWKHHTAQPAASNGHVECLKYLMSTGCVVDSNTTHAAIVGGSVSCLKLLVDSGCPVSPVSLGVRMTPECTEYLASL